VRTEIQGIDDLGRRRQQRHDLHHPIMAPWTCAGLVARPSWAVD
jgi:hypothetical protein